MSQAGDTVGKAVETGWRTLKANASKAGQVGADVTAKAAELADQKLSEHGLSPAQLGETASSNIERVRDEAVKSSRRARRTLARNAKKTRKDLARNAKKARAHAEKQSRKAATTASAKAAKKIEKAQRELDQRAELLRRHAAEQAQKVSAKATKKASKTLSKNAGKKIDKPKQLVQAEKSAAKATAKASKKIDQKSARGRRWPLALGIGVVGVGVTYAVRARAAQQVALEQDLPGSRPVPVPQNVNGVAPAATPLTPPAANSTRSTSDSVTPIRNAPQAADPVVKSTPSATPSAPSAPSEPSAPKTEKSPGASEQRSGQHALREDDTDKD